MISIISTQFFHFFVVPHRNRNAKPSVCKMEINFILSKLFGKHKEGNKLQVARQTEEGQDEATTTTNLLRI